MSTHPWLVAEERRIALTRALRTLCAAVINDSAARHECYAAAGIVATEAEDAEALRRLTTYWALYRPKSPPVPIPAPACTLPSAPIAMEVAHGC